MSKLYVFAIGGTGSRVLKALTMLLASGVSVPVDKVVPIIIDPDAAGGNKTDTVNILDLYRQFYSKIDHNDKQSTFFRTNIEKLNFPSNDYVLPLGGQTNQLFKNYMQFATFNVEDQALVNMLFSDDNLNADMTVGFTGNPNIGSVVLNQFAQSPQFTEFANDFNPGDKIFIISSIFGGTGASGFPLLLKNLRHIDPNLHVPSAQAIMDSKIGAISVLPYFSLSPGEPGAPDSDTFMSKTKSALAYYDNNLNNLNALYYIGDPAHQQYDNEPGGAAQRNKAHFIEFASALAIIDFAKTADGLTGNTVYKEYGIKNDTRKIKFKDLEMVDYICLSRPMSEFTLFCHYLRNKLNDSLDQKWINQGQPNYQQEFYGNVSHNALNQFIDFYMTWLEEMKENDRSFEPFNLNVASDNVFGFVKDVETKRVMSTKSNWDLVNDRLNSVDKAKISNSQSNTVGRFIVHMNAACTKLVDEKIKLQ